MFILKEKRKEKCVLVFETLLCLKGGNYVASCPRWIIRIFYIISAFVWIIRVFYIISAFVCLPYVRR